MMIVCDYMVVENANVPCYWLHCWSFRFEFVLNFYINLNVIVKLKLTLHVRVNQTFLDMIPPHLQCLDPSE